MINNSNPILLSELSDKFFIAEKELIDPLTFYCYAILSSDLYLNQFKGKLYNVAGEYSNIPITSDKEMFLSISALGKQLAKIESSYFIVEISNEIPEELEYHKYKIGENYINLLDTKNQLVKEYLDINENVLQFEISGYNVVREWLIPHSYPYYRKKLEKDDIKELDILLAKIGLYRIVISELNIGIKKILLGTFISSKR